MFGKFKYLVFDGRTGGDGIIFPPWIEHLEMRNKFENWEVLSAGFIEIGVENDDSNLTKSRMKIRCFGESNGLKIGAKDGDEYFFKNLISE